MANELRFRRLRLKNWKNFQDVDVEVRDRMFLVGANAAGKSNFLDVFRFLGDLASPGGGFGEAVGRRGGVSAIRCLAARRYPDVEIEVELREDGADRCWRYEIAFHQDNRRRPLLRRERVTLDGETIIDRPDSEDRGDAARLTQTHVEQVNMNSRFRELAAFFASVRYLHIVPQLVRDPDRSVGRSNDPYGGDFLEQIAKTPEHTRNANIPVLGDAELTLGLTAKGEADEGKASIKSEHMGSIDAQPVRYLVEDILEGGRDAFETRRLKYGF